MFENSDHELAKKVSTISVDNTGGKHRLTYEIPIICCNFHRLPKNYAFYLTICSY